MIVVFLIKEFVALFILIVPFSTIMIAGYAYALGVSEKFVNFATYLMILSLIASFVLYLIARCV
ncbi:hypothetical protein [Latilactobacillus graminis]|uniref:hypothetical protein n=1 Tax=Latilactobacillus graminis TaxID=60519 RepID=UPI00070C6B51|nr:hypothetical protein [Latilactobacillus graminis]